MPLEKAPEVDRHILNDEKDEHVRSAILIQPDGKLVREVPNGLRILGAEGQRREVLARYATSEREVRQLVALGRKPRSLGVSQHAIENHEPLDRSGHCHRLSMPVCGSPIAL